MSEKDFLRRAQYIDKRYPKAPAIFKCGKFLLLCTKELCPKECGCKGTDSACPSYTEEEKHNEIYGDYK